MFMKEDQKEKNAERVNKNVKELKQKHYDRIPTSANFSMEQKSIVEGLIFDAIEDAFAIGCKEKLLEGVDIKEAVSNIENLYKQMSTPTAAERAEKYKTLYYNQRIITAHAQAEVQILQAQIQTLESDGNLFTSIIERLPNIFGCPPVDNINNAFESATE